MPSHSSPPKFSRGLVWLRRDLRLNDHSALFHALQNCKEVYLAFIFDTHILDPLERDDRRVTFIIDSLLELKSDVILLHGDPVHLIPQLACELDVKALFFNRDYEPYAKTRDHQVVTALQKLKIDAFDFKDQVIFEKGEVLSQSNSPYKVFTPYKNRWLERFNERLQTLDDFTYPTKKMMAKLSSDNTLEQLPKKKKALFEALNFIPNPSAHFLGGRKEALQRFHDFLKNRLQNYHRLRDYPAEPNTSELSPYLRFGNLSIREVLKSALEQKDSASWINELIWREFFMMLLDFHPEVVSSPFRQEYAKLKWPGTKEHFRLWCEGQTGFPIVDAGMRCLNLTGSMPNRLRMITASFLTKILLVDYRWGEAYFAKHLMDFDLSANNGNWQWCASTGADAVPYFRIFNPSTQAKKFDEEELFIRTFCPEVGGFSYPDPIVDYKQQRARCLKFFK